MKQFFTKLALLFCFSSICMASQIEFELVDSPDWQRYWPIFLNFGLTSCAQSCDYNFLTTVLQKEFDQEVINSGNSDHDKIFVQARLGDEIIGYASCYITSDLQIHISQLAFDKLRYDSSSMKDFLFVLFETMPQVSKIFIKIPALNQDLIEVFEGFGFVSCDQQLSTLYLEYSLDVPEKCAICQVLYGPNFWEEDLDEDQVPSWLQDDSNVGPDQCLSGDDCSVYMVEDDQEISSIE